MEPIAVPTLRQWVYGGEHERERLKRISPVGVRNFANQREKMRTLEQLAATATDSD